MERTELCGTVSAAPICVLAHIVAACWSAPPIVRVSPQIWKPEAASWEACFDDLTKSGGVKLVPLMKELLGMLGDAERQLQE